MSYRPPPPRRDPRGYRDYDRPAEPARHQDYREDREDDFSIKGRANLDARPRERSPSSRGSDPREYDRSDWSRQRDSRYDSRPSRGGKDYPYDDGYSRQGSARDQYDSNPRNGRGEHYGRRAQYSHGRNRYDERRNSFDPTVDAQPNLPPAEPAYNGDKDVASYGDDPLNFLLVRGLKINVSAEVFAKGMEKLYRSEDQPEGATPGSLRCVMLICDRDVDGQKSLGFGFAWYHSTSDAMSAHAAAKKREPGFTISSRDVAVDMPHNGVFQRTDFAMRGTADRFTFVMPSTGLRFEYKDARFYPVEHVVNADPPEEDGPSKSPPTDVKIVPVASAGKKTKKRANESSDQQHAKKKQVQMSSDMQSLANRWGAARSELKEEPKETQLQQQATQSFASDGIDAQKRKACWLCKATFTTSEMLVIHLEDSAKHAENLQNDDLVQKAYKLMESQGVDPQLTLPSPAVKLRDAQASEYVDRAANRRAEEARSGSSTTNPGLEKMSFSLKNNKRNQTAADSDGATPAPISKGLNMLQKQGYQAGQGLGAAGSEGTTAPIATDLYAAGVGLGHASSKLGDAVKEADRMTKGDSAGYVEKVRDGAKARYEAAVGKDAT